ncbi:MAG: hypothetical protein A2073_04570 [Deltaproteobacteria bacterium GWC2_42_11]|nr:MAG: hypothetical protein A2073_04570 [Deltaproteobacteria bacterium GWC2_42_11]
MERVPSPSCKEGGGKNYDKVFHYPYILQISKRYAKDRKVIIFNLFNWLYQLEMRNYLKGCGNMVLLQD